MSNALEKFKAYPYNNDLLVSRNGELFRKSLGRAPKVYAYGNTKSPRYNAIAIKINGKQKTKKVSVIVLETFVGPRPDGYHCGHLNGNSKDDRLCNLKWITPSENAQHQKIHGTCMAPVNAKRGGGIRAKKQKGYYFLKKKNRWYAYIGVGNKSYSLGGYGTEIEAKAARKASLKLVDLLAVRDIHADIYLKNMKDKNGKL